MDGTVAAVDGDGAAMDGTVAALNDDDEVLNVVFSEVDIFK